MIAFECLASDTVCCRWMLLFFLDYTHEALFVSILWWIDQLRDNRNRSKFAVNERPVNEKHNRCVKLNSVNKTWANTAMTDENNRNNYSIFGRFFQTGTFLFSFADTNIAIDNVIENILLKIFMHKSHFLCLEYEVLISLRTNSQCFCYLYWVNHTQKKNQPKREQGMKCEKNLLFCGGSEKHGIFKFIICCIWQSECVWLVPMFSKHWREKKSTNDENKKTGRNIQVYDKIEGNI